MRKIGKNSILEREKIFSKNREKIAKKRDQECENRTPTDREQADQIGRPDPRPPTRSGKVDALQRLQNGNKITEW
jgi:hypothetical protein